ncbi:hypothetical protein A2U01_0073981, partial [Trifolium medium]|nr:hypothetical protein [Trifolium medium]
MLSCFCVYCIGVFLLIPSSLLLTLALHFLRFFLVRVLGY